MNRKVLFIVGLIFVAFIFIMLFKDTYAINEDNISDLILRFDIENLNDNFYNYIDKIDDTVIPTSSYVMSNVLSDNYDFLTLFAINYILKHSDDYIYDIVLMNNYTFNDGYNNYSTNKYVSKNVIYKITDEVFGKKDYVIINDYLKVVNDMVPLLLIYNYDFYMSIDKIINVLEDGNNYIVSVKYKDNDLIYKYIFLKDNDRLILKNIEV